MQNRIHKYPLNIADIQVLALPAGAKILTVQAQEGALIATKQLVIPTRDTDEWKRWNKVHRASPGPERWRERSRTYAGVAHAMATQWGAL
jgi:hypothetical protein